MCAQAEDGIRKGLPTAVVGRRAQDAEWRGVLRRRERWIEDGRLLELDVFLGV